MKRAVALFLSLCIALFPLNGAAVLKSAGGGSGSYNAASVAITGGTIDGTVVGGVTPAAGTFTTLTANTQSIFPAGSLATPGSVPSNNTAVGFGSTTSGRMFWSSGGVGQWEIRAGQVAHQSGMNVGWASGDPTSSALTSAMNYPGVTNAVLFSAAGGSGAGGVVTSRMEINKSITAIADATPTTTFTVTVPNAAHACSIRVRVTGSLGAGGAIGAFEASATNEYDITIARTAGVNAVATISSAYGAAAANVAGAATVTATLAMSAVSGAVGATNTFTINVTITRSGGSSTNHTAVLYASLLNSQASGCTIS